MKRASCFLAGCLAVLLAAATPASSFAALAVGDTIQVGFGTYGENINILQPPVSSWSGQIRVDVDGQPGASFDTFCLDFYKALTPVGYGTGLYEVTSLSASTVTEPVKWLYANYAMGQLDTALTTVVFQYDNNASANYLQQAIWYAQNNATVTSGDLTLSAEALAMYNEAVANANGDISYAVGLGTLDIIGGEDTQDLLYFTTDPILPSKPVPEPTTLAMWSLLSVAGLVAARRRRRIA